MGRLKSLPDRIGSPPNRIRPAPKVSLPFYKTPAWLGLMRSIKAERGNRCQDCGTRRGRIIGDHIIELKDGGAPLDRANIRLRCTACHNIKTAKAKAARSAGTTYRE